MHLLRQLAACPLFRGTSSITIISITITTITFIISAKIAVVLLETWEWSKAHGLSNGRWLEVATTTILSTGWA